MLLAGVSLAAGVFPRLAASVLAADLLAATYAAHAFWRVSAGPDRKRHFMAFLANMAILGGLLNFISEPTGPISRDR